ncbi:MAG: SEC-C metal-binding domain-containing protein [Desulfovermiculus sp.]|nr:SEC-C metal-binding domain-containing protein [Desulfovermiculus sp.]
MRHQELLNVLRTSDRTYPGVAAMADHLDQLSGDELTQFIEFLIAQGEDKAMGLLLNAIALGRIQIHPYILSQTLKIVHDIDDFTFPFREQDARAIDPLLELAFARDISIERNVLAATLAAELAVKFGVQQGEVKKVLIKLQNKSLPLEGKIYVQTTLDCLENNSYQDSLLSRFLERDIHQSLPKERPPRYIAQEHTVRRPVPKIGRNDPCHCGSGKKYKKCCLQKDQELFYNASPYAGLTMSQVISSPGMVEGTEVISNMRAYQIKKLNPEELKEDQLFAAYRRADVFGLHEIALNMLLELRDRPGKHDFALDHMHDLLYAALEAGNLELSKKIKHFLPQDDFHDQNIKQFHFELLENKDLFMTLEEQCRRSITENDMGSGNNLVDLAHCFDKTFPALSVVFSRAAMVEQSDAFLDNEVLLEIVRNARTDLDLDTYADPIEDILEWAMDMHDQDNELEEKEKVINELKQKIFEGRRVAVHKDRELREKERELKALSKKLEEGSLPGPSKYVQPEQAGTQGQGQGQENAARLKRRIEQLKMEIREQQQERRRLHQELESKEKAEIQRSLPEKSEHEMSSTQDEEDAQDVPALKRVHIPVYTEQFKKSCRQISAGIGAKALRAATGFATHDAPTLRQSKQLEKISSIYRIRVGINYRLMVRWKKGEDLEILDLIPRQEMDNWISNYVA